MRVTEPVCGLHFVYDYIYILVLWWYIQGSFLIAVICLRCHVTTFTEILAVFLYFSSWLNKIHIEAFQYFPSIPWRSRRLHLIVSELYKDELEYVLYKILCVEKIQQGIIGEKSWLISISIQTVHNVLDLMCALTCQTGSLCSGKSWKYFWASWTGGRVCNFKWVQVCTNLARLTKVYKPSLSLP